MNTNADSYYIAQLEKTIRELELAIETQAELLLAASEELEQIYSNGYTNADLTVHNYTSIRP